MLLLLVLVVVIVSAVLGFTGIILAVAGLAKIIFFLALIILVGLVIVNFVVKKGPN